MRQIRSVSMAIVVLLGMTDSALAGTIQGQVTVEGQASAGSVVVYLDHVTGTFSPKGPRPELLHRNLAFLPEVLPILKGTTVDFPNADPVFHSAFSVSPSNPFELGIYGQGREKFMQFRNPGVVDISCHIHPFMKATVIVLENPFFTITKDNGLYVIANVPPGPHTVKTWSASGMEQRQTISVPKSGTSVLNFTVTR